MFKSLRTVSFRNLADTDTDVSGTDVFLVGENGQGKTNFLEALYFCAYASSFRGVKDGDLARMDLPEGTRDFSAATELCSPESVINRTILVKYEKSRKSIVLDGKKIEDRRDLLETIPCVVFCHEDMEFVSGSQERRRWFFDQTQSLYDPVYLDDLRKYKRVLKTRNAILRDCRFGLSGRSAAEAVLDALDLQLAEYGLRLMEKRRKEAERFSAVFGALYGEVSGIDGIGVTYLSSWKESSRKQALPEPSAVAGYLAARREVDISAGLTAKGPHRDRYLFIRNGPGETYRDGDFSGAASTGQRRLLALLLRVAQARCFSENSGKTPVLLLDDVLLELDGEKRRRFLSVMPAYEQAFFTFLPEEPYKRYCRSDTLVYHVSDGVISES
ncbi:MAG: DNA replication and repair protein RecF [Spirochaetaceae bacterium]|nr:DNA replication and repair protein RecF [Spirochaetaceae bacterium]